jgi:uncharacterized protein
MRIVLDTNVFVSGVFFTGPPFEILNAWRAGKIEVVVSPSILNEYHRVGEELSIKFPGVSLKPALELLALNSLIVDAPALPNKVCRDSDDDKFLACAVYGKAMAIVTGDKDLLDISEYAGVTILKPRNFLDSHLK